MASTFAQMQIINELDAAENILIAGAGGGFDIFSGLPLYFYLRNAGKNVFLANYSFSRIKEGTRLTECMVHVTADLNKKFIGYLPEQYLVNWFATRNIETSIFAFDGYPGCIPLQRAYDLLVQEMRIDTIILVDGGSDSLLRGDESELGTPVEDMISIAAVNKIDSVKRKYLLSLGFGVERRISHSSVLESISELIKMDAFVGAFALTKEMDEVKQFMEASEYVFSKMPEAKSIVVTSVISALQGKFGNVHSTQRTRGSRLYINPLMPFLWCFRLEPLAQRVLYLSKISEATTIDEVAFAITRFRFDCKEKPWSPIPI